MQVSDELFFLIKSMSKAEKRYFKLHASLQKGEKDYLTLFEAMEQLSEEGSKEDELRENYDEALLKKRLKNKINVNQLHVTKSYLQTLILKSLRGQYEKVNTDEQLAVLLAEARVFERRGLYDQLSKKLASAKSLALKFEKHIILVDVYKLEIGLVSKRTLHEVEIELSPLYENLFTHLHYIEIEIKYRKLQNDLTSIYRRNVRARSIEEKRNLEVFNNNELLNENANPPTFTSKILYHYCRAICSLLLGDTHQGIHHYRKMIEVWTGYPHFKNEYPSTYIIYSSNYLIGCHNVRDYQPFPGLLDDLKNTSPRTFDEAAEAFQNIYFLEQLYFMNCAVFDTNTNPLDLATKLAASIAEGLEKYASRIVKSRQLSFFHNTTIMFFALGAYDNALEWLSKVQQSAKTDQRKEIQLLARLLQLIIFLEKGEHLYIDNAFKAFEYHLKKENKQKDFEGTVTVHLKRIAGQMIERKKLFETFKEDLQQFEPQKIPGYEEISIWVDSKLQKKTFLEVMKDRFDKLKAEREE